MSNERQQCNERRRHRLTGGSGIMRGDTSNSQGRQEASTPEKKRGMMRGSFVTRGGQMEAPTDRRRRRTRGNMTIS
jgi:hypothetical protein